MNVIQHPLPTAKRCFRLGEALARAIESYPEEMRFGILGTGFMARTYAEALRSHVPGGHLAAVALGSRAQALAADYGVAVEPSAEALEESV